MYDVFYGFVDLMPVLPILFSTVRGGKPMQIDCTTNKESSMDDNPTDPETLVDKTAFIIIAVCSIVLLSAVVIAVLVVKRYCFFFFKTCFGRTLHGNITLNKLVNVVLVKSMFIRSGACIHKLETFNQLKSS